MKMQNVMRVLQTVGEYSLIMVICGLAILWTGYIDRALFAAGYDLNPVRLFTPIGQSKFYGCFGAPLEEKPWSYFPLELEPYRLHATLLELGLPLWTSADDLNRILFARYLDCPESSSWRLLKIAYERENMCEVARRCGIDPTLPNEEIRDISLRQCAQEQKRYWGLPPTASDADLAAVAAAHEAELATLDKRRKQALHKIAVRIRPATREEIRAICKHYDEEEKHLQWDRRARQVNLPVTASQTAIEAAEAEKTDAEWCQKIKERQGLDKIPTTQQAVQCEQKQWFDDTRMPVLRVLKLPGTATDEQIHERARALCAAMGRSDPSLKNSGANSSSSWGEVVGYWGCTSPRAIDARTDFRKLDAGRLEAEDRVLSPNSIYRNRWTFVDPWYVVIYNRLLDGIFKMGQI